MYKTNSINNLLRILFFVFVAAFAVVSFPYIQPKVKYLLESPCDQTITYKIGTIEKDFNISKESLTEKSLQAADIWNRLVDRNLFQYDDNGELTINLINDTKQSLRSQIEETESKLESGKTSLDQQKQEYNNLVAQFEQKLANYNNTVDEWNKKGGAPLPIYNQLIQKKEELQTEADSLNAMATILNLSTQSYNLVVNELNETVDDYNENLSQRPEEGLYYSQTNTIDIYLYVSDPELIHTLAHEMGHALQLDHLDNPNTIMYQYTSETTTPTTEDIQSLYSICQQKNIEIIFKNYIENIKQKLSRDNN
ncbi:hypothetical protein A2X44_01870 [candidate division CPR3 bacterium GWF2_35_18]|uniref:Matrixin family protein n=1 Tax=candidate division CPR3 bacterium GW2011_GWF2_35_18 TaxID=1618350 RepID=A0A0G0BKH2_UNCC3|nr:MAG: Matrixin family protein [candidate division CPR3 bacterium GW2011_GWF2_35_18]KKP86290.1 MAG: Matrixin family protein [candidate division CPR3 bacterium GW2011_GWE2_35_7]OGB62747.1 MAG: hypothetical protein A2X44_01870 [candidate division CPR3 bacterium GWF2_35_18]OGB65328.1 MAG: hypothetical protein A2250_00085 [candidate division CPR3 bacterium RIFOXYA2_FULL_35_13]OGB78291.1 MAG: hypothetical protein A2296_02860 [candidate division CPR3 bacterium RIFOXYB2_FULL_35_8]OGB80289.1 MAG: hyp